MGKELVWLDLCSGLGGAKPSAQRWSVERKNMPKPRIPRAYFRRSDRAPRCQKCGRIHKHRTEAQCRRKKKIRTSHPYQNRVNKEGKRLYAPYGYRTTIERFGHLLTWLEMTGSERYVTSRRIAGAHHRNDFWRELGYPNLVRARTALKENATARLKAGQISPQRKALYRRIAAGEIKGHTGRRDEEKARIFSEGEREIQETQARPQSPRPMLGGILPAGLYSPEYMMRREMRILEVMRRCPA